MNSSKAIETVDGIERDVDMDMLTQKKNWVQYQLLVGKIPVIFVSDNNILGKSWRQRRKDKYAKDEKKKKLYADVVNSTHVNNINLPDIYLDLLKG